jgi:carboxymethylenebutenolidase
VIEHHLDLATADGAMNTFVTHPDEGGPFPVVLFYMDAPGKREELHDMARRIAATGYYVVLPNLYYRSAREFVRDPDDPASVTRMGELMASIGNRMVAADTATMLDFVDADDEADATRVGCVGYCMSGPFSLFVAAAYPDRVAAAASVYGVRLAVDSSDSPHLHVGSARAELYVACAEHDDHITPEMVDRFAKAAVDAGARCRIEWYPGTRHGFAFPQRPVYDKAAAETHWSRLHALFDRNLKPRH